MLRNFIDKYILRRKWVICRFTNDGRLLGIFHGFGWSIPCGGWSWNKLERSLYKRYTWKQAMLVVAALEVYDYEMRVIKWETHGLYTSTKIGE